MEAREKVPAGKVLKAVLTDLTTHLATTAISVDVLEARIQALEERHKIDLQAAEDSAKQNIRPKFSRLLEAIDTLPEGEF